MAAVLCCISGCRDATGKFPDYPDDDDGGSEAIFKKRQQPVKKCT